MALVTIVDDLKCKGTIQVVKDVQLDGAIQVTGGVQLDGTVKMTTLPAADPLVAGQLWNDAGILKVSAG